MESRKWTFTNNYNEKETAEISRKHDTEKITLRTENSHDVRKAVEASGNIEQYTIWICMHVC